jgi:hypothetical protein
MSACPVNRTTTLLSRASASRTAVRNVRASIKTDRNAQLLPMVGRDRRGSPEVIQMKSAPTDYYGGTADTHDCTAPIASPSKPWQCLPYLNVSVSRLWLWRWRFLLLCCHGSKPLHERRVHDVYDDAFRAVLGLRVGRRTSNELRINDTIRSTRDELWCALLVASHGQPLSLLRSKLACTPVAKR